MIIPVRVVRLLVLLAALAALAGVAMSRRRDQSSKTRFVPRIFSFKNCNHSSNYGLMGVPRIRIGRDGGDMVDVNLTLLRSVPHFKMVKVLLHKCGDAVSSNTCEYFATWTWSVGLCKMWENPTALWAPVYRAMEPEAKCPFQKGFYMIRNAAYDMESALMQSILRTQQNNVWWGRMSLYDPDGVEAGCVEASGKAMLTRRQPGSAS